MAGFGASVPVISGAADTAVDAPATVQAIPVAPSTPPQVPAPPQIRSLRDLGSTRDSSGPAVQGRHRAMTQTEAVPAALDLVPPLPRAHPTPAPPPAAPVIHPPTSPAPPTSTPAPKIPAPKIPAPKIPAPGTSFSAGFSEEQVQFASATVQSRVMDSLSEVVVPEDQQSLDELQEIAQSLDPGMDHAVRDALNAAADTAHARAAGLLDQPYCSDQLIMYIASASFRAALPRALQQTVSQVMEPAIDHLGADASVEPQLRGVIDRATLNASFEIAQQSTRTVAEAVVEATTRDAESRPDRGDHVRDRATRAPSGDDEPTGERESSGYERSATYEATEAIAPSFTW